MRIGVTIGFGKSTQYFINKAYINYLTDSGYEPVLLAPGNNLIATAKTCEGLLLPGGVDLDPTYYLEDNVNSYSVIPEFDDFERQALFAFAEAGKNVLGICRGFQLIAREFLQAHPEIDGAYGDNNSELLLTFLQHHSGHSQTDGLSLSRTAVSHMIDFLPELFLVEGKREGYEFVNSMHHQALQYEFPKNKKGSVQDVAGLRVLAWCRRGLGKKDPGVIVEAFSISDWLPGNILAVQWHPEELNDVRILHKIYGKPNARKKSKVVG